MSNIRKSGRFSFRSNKRYGYSRTNNSSNHYKFKTKENVSQMYDNYIKLAKEASSAGDRIQAEYYHQFADHYSRIMIENTIKLSNNENTSNTLEEKPIEDSNKENGQETKESSNKDISKAESLENKDTKDGIDENESSLEKVSFISQPANRTSKLKK